MNIRLFSLALLLLICLRPAPASAAPDFEAARLAAVAANPPGVSLTLSLPPGRTQFRQGEVIPLTAAFSSHLPKAYRLNAGPGLSGSGDRELPWNSDAFQVDNTTGAVDPLAVYYAHELGWGFSGGGPQFQDLEAQPVLIPYTLNDWLRFDAPGQYRVYLTSGRVINAGGPRQVPFLFHGRVMASNAVDLEILPRDPVRDAETLKQALPLFNADGFDPRVQQAKEAAVRAVRFLGTPDAVRAMVARYGHINDIYFFNSPAYSQTRLGLFGFAQPAIVTEEVANEIADPGFPIPLLLMQDLAQTQLFAAHPQSILPYKVADPEWNKRRQQLLRERRDALAALTEQNWSRLSAAVPAKQGRARAVSLYTLFQMGNAHPDERADRARALVPVFDDLTTEEQNGLLYDESWKLLRGPDMLPVLRRLLASPPRTLRDGAAGYEDVQLDSLALRRLMELSPAEGRALLLTQIQSAHPRVDLPTLCSLPDQTLPALDTLFAIRLESCLRSDGSSWQIEPYLVERYATRAILPRVKAMYGDDGDKWGCDIKFNLLAYFLRTDRTYGLKQLRKALASRKETSCYRLLLGDVAAVAPGPDVERMAVAHLHDPDIEVQCDAVKALGAYGSPAAEAPLWARIREWHRQWAGKAARVTPQVGQLEYVLTFALAASPGWLADRAKLQALENLCVTPGARSNMAAFVKEWTAPVSISYMGDRDDWSVVQYNQVPSLADLENKLSQFPRGTRFRLSSANLSDRTKRARAIGRLRPFLAARGMHLEEEPLPLHGPDGRIWVVWIKPVRRDRMRLSRTRRAAVLWCACASACLLAPLVRAQTLSPLQGAREALNRAHRAKNLGEMNNSLTNEGAATIGFGLVLADSMMSGLATTMTDALTPKGANPKGMAHEEASEKAFQGKVEALLKRYSLDGKTLKGAGESDTLPPSLVAHGHQFLADALVLTDEYEKSHASPKSEGTLGSQISGSDLPAPEACDFHVLSPARVQIVPRAHPKSPIEALLEGGQWRLNPPSNSSGTADGKPALKTITPQTAALLSAIKDGDADAVAQKLKADPALASSPQGYYKGMTGSISDTPLLEAAFHGDPKVIGLLLQYGAKVNAEDMFGEDALHKAVFFSGKDVVALLIAHGADVKHKDHFGKTALHVAAQDNDPDKVSLLLAHGADVNARDEEGKTPLALAMDSRGSSPDHVATLKLLRQHGGKK